MSRIKAAIDPIHTKPWLAPIGKVVLNFGATELQSHLWLADLSGSDRVADSDLYASFSTRVARIQERISASKLDDSLKVECGETWKTALGVAKQRNSILHNPVLFGWRGPDQSGPPDSIKILDVAHLGSKPPDTKKEITLSDLNELVDVTAQLGAKLVELRTKVQESL